MNGEKKILIRVWFEAIGCLKLVVPQLETFRPPTSLVTGGNRGHVPPGPGELIQVRRSPQPTTLQSKYQFNPLGKENGTSKQINCSSMILLFNSKLEVPAASPNCVKDTPVKDTQKECFFFSHTLNPHKTNSYLILLFTKWIMTNHDKLLVTN